MDSATEASTGGTGLGTQKTFGRFEKYFITPDDTQESNAPASRSGGVISLANPKRNVRGSFSVA